MIDNEQVYLTFRNIFIYFSYSRSPMMEISG